LDGFGKCKNKTNKFVKHLPEITIYTAPRIFTGAEWLTNHAIITSNGWIQEIIPADQLPAGSVTQNFPDAFIAPAFIDLQIYGAGEKLFSVFPEVDALQRLNVYCRSGGTVYCLPTVATNTYDVFFKSIDAVKEYWQQNGQGILGLHIEGPWINPVKKGAHLEECIHSPTIEQVQSLLEYGKGVIKMITLAPEVCSTEIIALVQSYGIVVSAGHSNASYEQAKESFAKGITTCTHLYNAMSPLQHRAPGLVGAILDHEKVMASIIPDGHHVDYAAIRIAKEVMKERLFVITDAVTSTSDGPYPHIKAGDKYEANGILSGSALTTNKAVYNLVNYAAVELGEALRMCSLYPARVMGMDNQLGCIAPGYKASLVILQENTLQMQLLTEE
jgi:N-acetylglucosamine-6-phosphate deacetylase